MRSRVALVFMGLVAPLGCSPAPPPASIPAPIVVAEIADAGHVVPAAAEPPDAGRPLSEVDPSPSEQAVREWSKRSGCDAFDYFPRGGIQSFWCHRPESVTLARVRAAARVPIFVSGPHTNDTLDLKAPYAFGHYNPAFVRWLVDVAGPSPRESKARIATQASYDATLRPLAEIFWKTYGKIRGEPDCFAREKRAYGEAIARHTLTKDYYERWFYFMNPYFCSRGLRHGDTFYFDNAFDAGIDGNVTKTVVGFWMRRSLDGTIDAFAEGLKKLVASYQPDLLEDPYRAADPASLTRALDAGVKGASTCKDPQAKRPSAFVEVLVSADGGIRAQLRGVSTSFVSEPQRACIASAFGAHTVPPFSGEPLRFSRTIPLR